MTQIGLLEEGDNRWYTDPGDPDADPYEAVSSILRITESLPWLAPWSAKITAQFVVEHLPMLLSIYAELGKDATVEVIKSEARRRRNLKRNMGSHQHDVLEALVTDRSIPAVPEELVGVEIDGERVDHDAISDGLVAFLSDFGLTDEHLLLSEATVANYEHGYAGTLDLGLWLPTLTLPWRDEPGARILVDCKTGRVSIRARAQMAAYRRCDDVWLDWSGNRAPLGNWDATAVLHIDRSLPRGYRFLLLPEDDSDAFEWFLQCKEILHHEENNAKLRWRPLYPPKEDGTQPLPDLADLPEGYGTVTGALIRNGVRSLEQVVMMTEPQVLSLRGVGPKGIEILRGLLAEYGADFRPKEA